nr:uncharacterized protein LOC123757447 isoform X1 [Procambarus clarkii]XP_045597019.1 uncharacterized protein LOC123757447 isoform X1 [Procambarus clarkii]XP_045597020.1 uncharacterized protein LOC123757447 isoform X1 [Procambarus clarkii]XP_045597021.1 uncharacterized protein LOC123757447 isoform X1 [Procambarus clarkii]
MFIVMPHMKGEKMMLAAVVLVVVMVGEGVAAPQAATGRQTLENAFNDRATVEAIIQCFLGDRKCNPQEEKIKERALASLKNFGTCPSHLCTQAEQQEITRSMELLQSKHPDLWSKLILALLGINIPIIGRK